MEPFAIVVQIGLDGRWGSDEDLKLRYKLEDTIEKALADNKNGICDGGDIGSGTINIYLFVTDPELARNDVIRVLRDNALANKAVVALRRVYETEAEELANSDSEYRVVYPEGFVGDFNLL